MVWQIVRYYALVSLVIGFVVAVASAWKNRKSLVSKELSKSFVDELLDDKIQKGHIQKETYGERVVYQEKNLYGEMYLNGVERTNNLKKHTQVYIVVFLVVGTISSAVEWPKMLYTWVTNKGE